MTIGYKAFFNYIRILRLLKSLQIPLIIVFFIFLKTINKFFDK